MHGCQLQNYPSQKLYIEMQYSTGSDPDNIIFRLNLSIMDSLGSGISGFCFPLRDNIYRDLFGTQNVMS